MLASSYGASVAYLARRLRARGGNHAESFFPGGAANVARNLQRARFFRQYPRVSGTDAGAELRGLPGTTGVDTNGLIRGSQPPHRRSKPVSSPTINRWSIDREKCVGLSAALERKVLEAFVSAPKNVTAVVSRYAKGVLSQKLLNILSDRRTRAQNYRADPNSRQRLRYAGLTAVTPNRTRLAAAGLRMSSPSTMYCATKRCCVSAKVLRTWKPRNLLITLGEHGVCLFRPGRKPHHIPTVAQEVFMYRAPGDTVIATLVLALAAGAGPIEAAEISNHAAGCRRGQGRHRHLLAERIGGKLRAQQSLARARLLADRFLADLQALQLGLHKSCHGNPDRCRA